MHADAEVPFLGPAARGGQTPLIISGRGDCGAGVILERVQPRPVVKEMPRKHRIQNARIARQIGGERGRRRGNLHNQVGELRVCFKKGEKLHPRRQPRKEAIKGGQSLIRFGGVLQARQDQRFHPLENLLGAGAAEGGIVDPPLGHLLPPFGGHLRRGIGCEETFGQIVHGVEPIPQVFLQIVPRRAHKRGKTVKASFIAWQRVGLRVADHLQAMLHLAVVAVVVCELVPLPLRNPAASGQLRQTFNGFAGPQ